MREDGPVKRDRITRPLPGMTTISTGSLPSSRAMAGLLEEKGIRCELDLWGQDVSDD